MEATPTLRMKSEGKGKVQLNMREIQQTENEKTLRRICAKEEVRLHKEREKEMTDHA